MQSDNYDIRVAHDRKLGWKLYKLDNNSVKHSNT